MTLLDDAWLPLRRPATTSLRGIIAAARGTLVLWHRRSAERALLATLSVRDLADMNATPGDVFREINKPFWRA